ncbi:MAG: transketolase [Candidatus Caenarcaniphilales bacterium]|nr:transketolase [Candidatus Caenarcaniphilales bacterium]
MPISTEKIFFLADSPQELEEYARQIRINALKAIAQAKSGHPGGSLSAADILSVLYFGVMRHSPSNPGWKERDRLIVSKGHISPGVYAALGLAGYFALDDFIATFRQANSRFQGHIDHLKVPGVEVSTGSLGHGLSIANGVALGLRLDASPSRVYALLSDGELQEGQSWEAAMSAAHFKLGNLTAIVDRNRIQLDGFTEETMALEPLADKFKAFGWIVIEIDGHDISQIQAALLRSQKRELIDLPCLILANTVKGKGVSFMEHQVKWHGVAPKPDELVKALSELQPR